MGTVNETAISAEQPPSVEAQLTTGSVLAVFSARWCPITRLLAKAGETAGCTVVEIDVEAFPHIADRYTVTVLPTLVALHDGVEQGRNIGSVSDTELKAMAAMMRGTP